MQRAMMPSITLRSRLAVAMVIFALLAFTCVRTSPLNLGVGAGSELSKTTPKQRNLCVTQFQIAPPPLAWPAFSLQDTHEVLAEVLTPASPTTFPAATSRFPLPPNFSLV